VLTVTPLRAGVAAAVFIIPENALIFLRLSDPQAAAP